MVFTVASWAEAATWQWQAMQNRERISIQFDQPVENYTTKRDSADVFSLELPFDPQNLNQEGGGIQSNLLSNVVLDNNSIDFNMQNPAFGYIVSQPTPNRLIIDVYSDPLGARFAPATNTNAENPPAANTTPTTATNPVPPPVNSNTPVVNTPLTTVAGGAVENTVTEIAPADAQNSPDIIQPETIPNMNQNVGNVDVPLENPITEPNLNPLPEDYTLSRTTEGNTTTTVETYTQDNPQVPSEDNPNELPPVLPLPVPPPMPMDTAPNAPLNPPVVEYTTPGGSGLPDPEPFFGHAFNAPLTQAEYNSPESIPQPRNVLGAQDVQAPQYKGQMTQEIYQPTPEETQSTSTLPPVQNSTASLFAPANTTPIQANTTSIQANTTSIQENATPASDVLNEISQNISANTPVGLIPQNGSSNAIQNLTPYGSSNLSQNVTQNTTQNATQNATNATVNTDVYPYNLLLASNSTVQIPLSEALAQNQTVIYRDAAGNEVEAPPNITQLLADMRNFMQKSRFMDAISVMDKLKNLRLDVDNEKHKLLREEVLYNYMNALFRLHEPNLGAATAEIVNAASEAMNFNPQSSRIPDALNVLALTHLKSGNQEDAKGYIMLLKRQYPSYGNVPVLLFQLGHDQLQKGQYADAAITFNTIVQEYPDSKTAKEAAYFLADSYYLQGHYDKALPVIDFINKRWPDVYLEVPEYLSMAADVQISQGRLDDAVKTLWTQYNINPLSESVPKNLTKLSELYYVLGNKEAAAKILGEILTAFPESEYAPLALLRLGENGMTPINPSLDQILTMFDQPNPRIPSINYQEIIDKYPDSPYVADAKTRLAAWAFRNKENSQALEKAQDVLDNYPSQPQFNVALDILLQAFSQDMALALAEENFERVLTMWEKYSIAQPYYLPLEPDMRVALARGNLNRGKEQEGLALLEPFIDYYQDPKYGLYVYNLFLANYMKNANWNGILDMAEKVNNWNMPLDLRNQHEYTVALSAENLGLFATALPLWEKLARNTEIPLYQRAYATYFLARDAERRQDLRASYQYNLDTLAMFEQLVEERSPYAESERVRESIAALMDVTEVAGRYAESLEWLNRYALYVPPDSPDYAGLQFREARLYRKMGDMNRWQAILEAIVKREPDSVFGKMAASELNTEKMSRDLNRFLN